MNKTPINSHLKAEVELLCMFKTKHLWNRCICNSQCLLESANSKTVTKQLVFWSKCILTECVFVKNIQKTMCPKK